MITERLWRVCGLVLVIALAANTMLWWIARGDEEFAKIIAVASLVAAVALIVARFVRRLQWLSGESFLAAMAVWVANAIEFGFNDHASTETKIRQCGFYVSFALLALGMYLVQALAQRGEVTE